MDPEHQRAAEQSGLAWRHLWDDIDLELVLELGERYLSSVHPTPERTILMAILLRVRQLAKAVDVP